jgi:hypothetical protein
MLMSCSVVRAAVVDRLVHHATIVDGRPTDQQGGARPSARAAGHAGPSSPAEGDPCGPAAARRHRG